MILPAYPLQQELVVNGLELAFRRTAGAANRPTLVFLHDSLGSIDLWRDFPAALGAATNCPTLVYDRQGHGRSSPFTGELRPTTYMEAEADVLEQVLVHCGIGQVILFGHSDGGSIALLAAAKHPARVRAVITEGAHIFVEEVTLAGIRAAVEAYQTTNLPQRLQKYHSAKTEALFAAWAHTWLRADYRDWNIEAFLPLVACPVLVVQGEEDEYGSLAQVEGIVQQVAGPARPLLIPGIGHSPHKDSRETVLEQAAAFISQVVEKG
ncbi:alpha/beta hydrolase [Hymenobacter sp. BT188]|uniref:alpha/beta fold hydrolase n=1 Tax=Hymenobacter sp. BT188 TaxID=2763504 RepID=UPI0016513B14|nr:alpha/beta hydrolase [Hymenobacter sp. BT188]MBC6605390.1 alpha/beta hydrolase [Hymenobacter sp. BT188]